VTLTTTRIILWHVDPLLGDSLEISSYTTAVVRYWQASDTHATIEELLEAAFSVLSVRQLCDATIQEPLEAAFSVLAMRQLCDATIQEPLEIVFSMRSVFRCYKRAKSRF
jgi:hypothetical protein